LHNFLSSLIFYAGFAADTMLHSKHNAAATTPNPRQRGTGFPTSAGKLQPTKLGKEGDLVLRIKKPAPKHGFN